MMATVFSIYNMLAGMIAAVTATPSRQTPQ
jgi:hypothetical protein